MNEEWRPVLGCEGRYEVSNQGRVRSLARGTRKQHLDRKGYWRVSLPRNGNWSAQPVHRLVLEAFSGPRPDGLFACHNDGNPQNNVISNLRWDTPSGNMLDVRLHGRHKNALKTHCPSGHPYSGDNVRVYRQRGGRLRKCVTCHRERNRAWAAKKRTTVNEEATP